MTSLPRAYWCRREGPGAPVSGTAVAPAAAVDWMRESVRAVTPELDRDAFDLAWAWLGNHREREAAACLLRAGLPYRHSVRAGCGIWFWSVHPVRVLPLLENETNPFCVHWRTP
ncbi:hypothetical protein [Streptomyces sp. NPDC007088]|uniref:hypothetical protein n=1 Tax=Streptomyces sp. NPDC007088 TaxID=3364773 RepID=UPI00369654C2